MMVTVDSTDSQPLLGGRLCLDFVNTVDPRVGEERRDYLDSYAALIRWSVHACALPSAQAARLFVLEADHPEEAGSTLVFARDVREALFGVLLAVIERRPAPTNDLSVVNRAIQASLGHSVLVQRPDATFAPEWSPSTHVERPLWPVACSAADLLGDHQALTRVRICGGTLEASCGWVFYDQTKNASRRWCRMETCGTRAKTRRYRKRRLSMNG